MEKMREDYNSDTRKVVFLATSDKVKWLRDHLVSKDDIYYPHQMIRQSKVALPSIKEISMMHAHRALSVKGRGRMYDTYDGCYCRSHVVRC